MNLRSKPRFSLTPGIAKSGVMISVWTPLVPRSPTPWGIVRTSTPTVFLVRTNMDQMIIRQCTLSSHWWEWMVTSAQNTSELINHICDKFYNLQGILILTFSRSISKVGNSRPWRISLSRMSILENPFHSVNSRWRSTFGIRASSPSLVGGKCLKPLVFVPSPQNLTWFTLIIIRRKVHQTLQRFVRFFSYKEMSGSWYWI